MKAIRTALAALIPLASLASAFAGDYGCTPQPCGRYETVCVTRVVQVPCSYVVTRYDHCGRPYQETRTTYRPVPVTVRKAVWVAG